MITSLVPWFCGIVGAGMIAYWLVMLISGKIPERKTEPFRIVFHIVAEMVTGLVLIVSAISISINGKYSQFIFHFSTGMLVYTLIISSGYFANKKQWIWIGFFFCIFILSVSCIFLIL